MRVPLCSPPWPMKRSSCLQPAAEAVPCAMCKCQGIRRRRKHPCDRKPGIFTRREQLNQWRLGCQVKVREDMKIGIPPEVFGIKKWEVRSDLQPQRRYFHQGICSESCLKAKSSISNQGVISRSMSRPVKSTIAPISSLKRNTGRMG